MALKFSKRKKICKGVSVNISKRGVSTSVKVGKTTFNSRGKTTTSICKGLSYTTGTKKRY